MPNSIQCTEKQHVNSRPTMAIHCHSAYLNYTLLPNTCSTRAPRYNTHRLLVVPARELSFWKKSPSQIIKFNGFNAAVQTADEDDNPSQEQRQKFTFGLKSTGKQSISLWNQSNPLSLGGFRQQDTRTVFVAGAAGQFGARISQLLLRAGFRVRAGVPDLLFAQEVAQFAAQYQIITINDTKRLNAVEFDFKDAESIAKAIGNASKAVVTIGPTEDGPRSKVTTNDALRVFEAAKLANVKHVVIVYEIDGASVNDGILDGITTFFSNLFAGKSELSLAELIDRIVETDISYTILKASSTDDFSTENRHNLVLSPEGSAGVNDKVSKIQVASVVAGVFGNTSIAENKIIEVATSSSAPLRPIDELLSTIPTDGRKEAFAEARAKAKAEEEAQTAIENARKAEELAAQLNAEAKKLSEREAKVAARAAEAQAKAEAAASSVDYFASKAKELGIDIFRKAKGIQTITSVASEFQKNLETQIVTVTGGGKAAALLPKKSVPAEPKQVPSVNKIFGGLFQQETIYVDDD